MVRFRDGKPTGIYYSQHSSGAAYEWNDTRLSLEDERVSLYHSLRTSDPIMYLTHVSIAPRLQRIRLSREFRI